MTRAQLEHLLGAASALTNEHDFVVVGSQAILGQFPQAPDLLLVSVEADLGTMTLPEERVQALRRQVRRLGPG